jgi:Fur family iron response transcriptional regulator
MMRIVWNCKRLFRFPRIFRPCRETVASKRRAAAAFAGQGCVWYGRTNLVASDRRTAKLSPSGRVEKTNMGGLWVKLASAGVRPTRQRIELAEILFGKGERHFTAEMIHAEARALRYPPSLGTVYNTLNHFVENGLLREIALYDSKLWYDTNTGPHCHYYWEDTNELSDIPPEHAPSLAVPAPPGGKVLAIDIVVRVRSDETARQCPMADFEQFLK